MRSLTAFLALSLTTLVSEAQSPDQTNVVLAVARPISAELTRKLSGPIDADTILYGDLYRVRLRSVRVTEGSAEVPRRLTVELMALHPEYITANREIFVLLKVRESGAVESFAWVAWGVPSVVACISSGTAEGTTLEEQFGRFGALWSFADRQCAFLEP
jgi:hypothetical protein